MTTPKLSMPELSVSQQGKELTHNEALAILDQLTQARVVDKDTAIPPVSPSNGDAYIVAGSPTGDWTGHANHIAYWLDAAGIWQFLTPFAGWQVWVADEAERYEYSGSSWAVASGGGGGVDVEDSGTPVAAANTINFIGAIVTDQGGGLVDVEIPGGGFTGGTLASALNGAPIASIASASTVNIGAAAANTINVTGTTTITAFDTIASGAERELIFTSALVLTHNATSLILPTAANITTAAGDAATFVSLGSGNWKCTGYMRADGTALVGGSLVNFTETKHTTSPNSGGLPVVSLAPNVTDAYADIALPPKGNGAFILAIPDNTTTGGNKRGTKAIDLQRTRSANTKIAAGSQSSVLGGQDNATGASATNSVVVAGHTNTATGANNFVGGGTSNSTTNTDSAVCGGNANTADGEYSAILGGRQGTTRGSQSAQAHASGLFATQGDAQRRNFVHRRSTPSAAALAISSNGNNPAADTAVVLPNNSAFRFTAEVVARNSSDEASFLINGLIKRGANAAATALVGTPSSVLEFSSAGASGWLCAVTANTTLGALELTVSGAAAKWVAQIRTTEVVG